MLPDLGKVRTFSKEFIKSDDHIDVDVVIVFKGIYQKRWPHQRRRRWRRRYVEDVRGSKWKCL